MNVLLALPLAAAFSIRFRRRFEETVAPAIFVLIIALYFSGIFTTLLPGVAACLAMSAASLVYCAVRLIKASPGTGTAVSRPVARTESRREVISRIFTPGALAFLLLAGYFIAVNVGRGFCARDDFGHWALAVKNYLYYQDFSNIAASTDRNGTYPPAATLWNYLGALLFPRNGSFLVRRDVTPLADASAAQFFSQEMLETALFLPLFSSLGISGTGKSRGRDAAGFLLLLLAFPLLINGCYEVWYTSVMVDPLLGLYAGYILWGLLHLEEKDQGFSLFSLCGALFLLTLTKEMGIVLAGLLAVIGPMTLLPPAPGTEPDAGSGVKRHGFLAGRIRLAGLFLLSVAAAIVSWYGYLAVWSRLEAVRQTVVVGNASTGGKAAVGGHVGTVFTKMNTLDPQISWDIFRTYCYALFDSRRTPFGAILPVSFVMMMFLFALVVVVVTVRRVQSGSFTGADRRFCRLYAGGWIAGWIFSGCLCLAYITVFRSIGVTLPSMDRYLAPVIVMQAVLFIGFGMEREVSAEPMRAAVLLAVGSALLLLYGNPGRILQGVTLREDRQMPVSDLAEDIRREGILFEPGDRVYLLKSEDGLSDVRYAFGYLVMPARINSREFGVDREDVTDPSYQYLYDAECPAGGRLFRRDELTGSWEEYQR
ncbi:MAG: hypothetical protein II800_00795 [Lachnospiraceae bacterium]|nr:hypothetical protein [Lachnospiraceae bacterium]